jgi:hypothetical protein
VELVDKNQDSHEISYSAFISHASEDGAKAEEICRQLEASGFRCWTAPRDVRPGQDYPTEIIRGIELSKCLVLVLSEKANNSNFVRAEVERAYSKGKPVFPIRVEEVLPSRALELFISTTHWIDAWHGDLAHHTSKLAKELGQHGDLEIGLSPQLQRRIRIGRFLRLAGSAVGVALIAILVALIMRPSFRESRESATTSATVSVPTPVTQASSPVSSSPVPSSAAVVSKSPSPEVDPCSTKSYCYNAGPFTGEVTQLIGSNNHRVVRLNIRFRNTTNEPLILAYVAGSSKIVDNLGTVYYWGPASAHDTSVTGIGIVESRTIDPQFVLKPGESGSAVFELKRDEWSKNAVGTSFTFDARIAQLEITGEGQKARKLRDYVLNFPDLPPSVREKPL